MDKNKILSIESIKNESVEGLVELYRQGYRLDVHPRAFLTSTDTNLCKQIADILLEIDISPEFGNSASVQDDIKGADFIIADLTGNNPNVMYEVGFAHALRKPVLPIVQSKQTQIPNDLAGYVYITYDASNLGELRNKIHNWVKSWIIRRYPESGGVQND